LHYYAPHTNYTVPLSPIDYLTSWKGTNVSLKCKGDLEETDPPSQRCGHLETYLNMPKGTTKSCMHVILTSKKHMTVEFWAIEKVMVEYGFSQHFRDIIQGICKNSTCNVILPHGLSDTINITRGVRQGCPLSPIIFIMFLEPLMLQLEGMKTGYKIDGGDPIPGGAYADDMVLHANTRPELQKLLNTCVSYFEYI
jgi:hypothetical protein